MKSILFLLFTTFILYAPPTVAQLVMPTKAQFNEQLDLINIGLKKYPKTKFVAHIDYVSYTIILTSKTTKIEVPLSEGKWFFYNISKGKIKIYNSGDDSLLVVNNQKVKMYLIYCKTKDKETIDNYILNPIAKIKQLVDDKNRIEGMSKEELTKVNKELIDEKNEIYFLRNFPFKETFTATKTGFDNLKAGDIQKTVDGKHYYNTIFTDFPGLKSEISVDPKTGICQLVLRADYLRHYYLSFHIEKHKGLIDRSQVDDHYVIEEDNIPYGFIYTREEGRMTITSYNWKQFNEQFENILKSGKEDGLKTDLPLFNRVTGYKTADKSNNSTLLSYFFNGEETKILDNFIGTYMFETPERFKSGEYVLDENYVSKYLRYYSDPNSAKENLVRVTHYAFDYAGRTIFMTKADSKANAGCTVFFVIGETQSIEEKLLKGDNLADQIWAENQKQYEKNLEEWRARNKRMKEARFDRLFSSNREAHFEQSVEKLQKALSENDRVTVSGWGVKRAVANIKLDDYYGKYTLIILTSDGTKPNYRLSCKRYNLSENEVIEGSYYASAADYNKTAREHFDQFYKVNSSYAITYSSVDFNSGCDFENKGKTYEEIIAIESTRDFKLKIDVGKTEFDKTNPLVGYIVISISE
ncbi:hypothetical protein E1J38_012040 [Seonamhaeicola sediminis]|uniref:Uncharacterized protein n=1 Tax=Seonamhaeicola sediminis TaxID=2528206 RepID=A0A562YCH4_9FLAO|nr:hypothetical protein [Seonamhaeicola sediminis]TWO31802.1 hypothetical protein E1J38_012040 [Seonamhaeicola sediminis]